MSPPKSEAEVSWDKKYNAFLKSHPKPASSEARVSWEQKYNGFLKGHPKPLKSEAEVSWDEKYNAFLKSHPKPASSEARVSWEQKYNGFLKGHPKPLKSEAEVSWDEKYNAFLKSHPEPRRSEAEVSWDVKFNDFLNSHPKPNVTKPSTKKPKKPVDALRGPDGQLPQKLKGIPVDLIEKICNEIMDGDPNVHWDDIAGLDNAKKCVNEMVILPMLRPDIFTGCRFPGRGLLLFGPPGTGKTMIGKAIAGEAKATFLYISSSTLTSCYFGESEKLVRALFGVASCRQPAVIFLDEIDSLLSKRTSKDSQIIRAQKTQLLIEMDGFASGNDQVLVIGATNRPEDLDEAALRRFTKRFYIPLPSSDARACIICNLLKKDGLFKLSPEDIDSICKLTEGYSGSDMKNLVNAAAMGPVREALEECTDPANLIKDRLRPVTIQDFENSLKEVRPSVCLDQLGTYEDWNNQFGSLSPSKTDASSQHHITGLDNHVNDEPKDERSDPINHQIKNLKTIISGAYIKSSHAQINNALDDNVYNNSYEKYDSEKLEALKGIHETMLAKIKVKEIDSLYKDTSNMSFQMKEIYQKRCQEIIEKYDL